MSYYNLLKVKAIFFVCILFLTNCGNSDHTTQESAVENTETPPLPTVDLIIDIKTISGKTLSEVEKVLGKVERTEKVKGYPCEHSECKRGFFKAGEYEIIFKSGLADRITIQNVPDLTSNEQAITALGFPFSSASFKNPTFVIRWQQVEDIHEISFFPDYVLIQRTIPD